MYTTTAITLLCCIVAVLRGAEAYGVGTTGTAVVTYYNSYPRCCSDSTVDQTECDDYSGCEYQGAFAWWSDIKSQSYVKTHNIVALYDDADYSGKNWKSRWGGYIVRITKKKNGVVWKQFDAIIADTCGNNDCGGCCSTNSKGGFLIDLEYNTVMNNWGSTSEVSGTISFEIISGPTQTAPSPSGSAPSPAPAPTPTPRPPTSVSNPTHTIWDTQLEHEWNYQAGWRAITLEDGNDSTRGPVVRFSLEQTAALGFVRGSSASFNWQEKGYTAIRFSMKLETPNSNPGGYKLKMSIRSTSSGSQPANGKEKALTLYNDWQQYTVALDAELGATAFPVITGSGSQASKIIFKWDTSSGNSPTILIDDVQFYNGN